MENINISKEILTRLAKLQEDIEYIKIQMKMDKDLEMEMNDWEKASANDTSNFLEKHNL